MTTGSSRTIIRPCDPRNESGQPDQRFESIRGCLTNLGHRGHPAGMISEIWIYRTANKLIEQHGAKALSEADRLIELAIDRRQADRMLLMFRVRLAIRTLQAAPSGLLH